METCSTLISFGWLKPIAVQMEIVCSKDVSRFCGQPHLSTRTLGRGTFALTGQLSTTRRVTLLGGCKRDLGIRD